MAEPIPESKQARFVKVILERSGEILRIYDDTEKYAPYRTPDLPLDGEQYNWSLEEYKDKPLSRQPKYAKEVNVSANDKNDKTDLSTIALGATELIKLDVGYWGAYHRKREAGGPEASKGPQRDFGMIDGHDVWLCRFSGKGKVADSEKLFTPGSLARKFVDQLNANGFGVEVISYALAAQSPATDGLATDRLMIIFPDLHLPEKWPDRPPEKVRHGSPGDRSACLALQKMFRQCQRSNLGLTNILDTLDRKAIQDHLEKIDNGHNVDWDLTYAASYTPLPVITPLGPVVVAMQNNKSEKFSPQEFLAEKDIVDREMVLESCWFYAPGPTKDGDATPAVDLANFLCELETFGTSNKLEVVQVGDMFELWMNREFLYRDFKASSSGFKPGSRAALSVIKYTSLTSDDYQYRMDRKWKGTPTDTPHPIKRYVFHNWPYSTLVKRHVTGTAGISPGAWELVRARELLKDRISGVKTFSLPMPAGATRPPGIDGYKKTNRLDQEEYYWNSFILDKFKALSTKRIWGNHDGYRGDPALAVGLSAPDDASAWISQKGLWIEHSHRWDDYNRDGMAFGAGVTNLVYYYCQTILSFDPYKDPFLASEQRSFQCGAAFWFLLVNFGDTSKLFKPPDVVLPFGIYVNGHTHTADLIRVVFKLNLLARIVDSVESGATKAKDAVKDKAQEIIDGIADGIGQIGHVNDELLKELQY